MKIFSTYCVNALQQISRAAVITLISGISISTFAGEPTQKEITINLHGEEFASIRRAAKGRGAETKSAEASPLVGRRIQLLEISPMLLQFEFPNFTYHWITSEAQYKDFWKKNSKISGDAPPLNLNWRTDSILALFWESKDAVVRIPTYMGAEEVDNNGQKTLNLKFGQNTPCIGIITSNSPSMFLVVDRNFADLDAIVLKTETTKSTGCF